MDDHIEHIVYLIDKSDLDPTIKEILMRDLKSEGLTDFLREQIKAYCMEGIKVIDARIEEAQKILDNNEPKNPAE
jgi:pimeloyl-CoA synthetase